MRCPTGTGPSRNVFGGPERWNFPHVLFGPSFERGWQLSPLRVDCARRLLTKAIGFDAAEGQRTAFSHR